jgi:hypothetical protein
MALITDYATLVTAISDYLARSDLTSYIPNFLQNAQTKIYRSLRLRSMETTLSGTMSGGVLALPDDYLQLKYAYLDTSPKVFLERTSPETIYTKYRAGNRSGRPLDIAREGSNFIFGPLPDSDYAVGGVYYSLPELLSESNPTNWFLENASDVLLYASLLEAQPFLMNDKRIPTWASFMSESIRLLQEQEKRENSSGSTLATRVS